MIEGNPEDYAEEGEEEQPDSSQPYINPFQSPGYNVVDKQLETIPTLSQLRDWLLGIKGYDEDNKAIIDEKLKMCNEKGANAYLAEVNSSLDPHVVLAYLTVDEVRRMAEEFEKDLAYKTILNGDKWEIDENNYDIVCDVIGRIYFTNLTRTINGATHKGITQVSLVREQLIQREGQPKEEKTGFFETLGFKKRR